MDFVEGPELAAITESARKASEAVNRSDGDDRQMWQALSEVGLTGLLIEPCRGGLGLGMAETVAAMIGLGWAPGAFPWVECVVYVPTILSAVSDYSLVNDRLAAIAAGQQRIGLARRLGTSGLVEAGDVANYDEVAVLDGPRLIFADTESWSIRPGHGVLTAPAGSGRRLDDLPAAEQFSVPPAALESAEARARTAGAALLLGAGERALELAVAHAKVREQFGRAIGTFQAVKHPLADARIELTMSRSFVFAAALSLDGAAEQATRDSAAALLSSTAAAESAIRSSLQAHGALGYTDESPIGELLNCVLTSTAQWGPTEVLRDELHRSLLASGAPVGAGGER
jgi:alkylation response protein AidB-like acyl-CoA dehydrogenase